jgi:hypothetical protein
VRRTEVDIEEGAASQGESRPALSGFGGDASAGSSTGTSTGTSTAGSEFERTGERR